MPFQLSPGVQVVEKDFSSIVPSVSSSAGAYAGEFAWGPIEDPIRISSENELVERFGKPNDENFESFLTAANFLSYTNNLLVCRADSSGARNAVSQLSGTVTTISLSDAGSNYQTATPSVTVGAPNINGGVQATATAVTQDLGFLNTLTGVTTADAGSGMSDGTYTLVFTAPTDPNGVTATAEVVVSGGTAGTPTNFNAGSGYTADQTVTATMPGTAGGTAATFTVASTPSTTVRLYQITGITVTEPGSGYISAPSVTIADPVAGGQTATAGVPSLTFQALKIKNVTEYVTAYGNGEGVHGQFAAKFPGTMGNGLRVVVIDSGAWNSNATAAQKALFPSAPGTSSYAQTYGITDDEVHVVVYDTSSGTFSGNPNSVLEKYSFLSKLSDAKKSDGANNYYKSAINASSKYVWWMDHPYASQMSEPSSSVVYTSKTTTFNAGTNTIVTSDADARAAIASLKTFLDAAPDGDTRQISITGSINNTGVFTIALNNAGNPDIIIQEGVSATIKVVESLSADTASASMSLVAKAAWGSSSEAVAASVGANAMGVLGSTLNSVLLGGVDDFNSSEGNIVAAFSMFSNVEQYDVSLIPLGSVPASVAKSVLDNVVEVRKDCMMFVSPRNTDGTAITSTGSTATNAIKTYRDAAQINSSYAVIDSGFKYQYDRYNDKYRWVPLNGDIAGLCARTDFTADPWFSPGGFNRGVIKNIVKLAFNPTQADRDVLYVAGVNPVVTFPGQGTILFGDKTMLTKPSAFDRINVRRLFIVLEKAISVAAKYQMFEFNDSFTRAQFKNLVEPFLRDVQGRRGVVDFRVVCDETNNTGEVIDRNEFVADIFVKPSRSINFITLNFVAARSSVNFEEIGA